MANFVIKNGELYHSDNYLMHYKYIEKKRGKNGGWIYIYPNDTHTKETLNKNGTVTMTDTRHFKGENFSRSYKYDHEKHKSGEHVGYGKFESDDGKSTLEVIKSNSLFSSLTTTKVTVGSAFANKSATTHTTYTKCEGVLERVGKKVAGFFAKLFKR